MHGTTTLQAQYSAFPALIVVREEDDGRKLVTPIPLDKAAVVLRVLAYGLVIALMQHVSPAVQGLWLNLAVPAAAMSCKLAMGWMLGAHMGRSPAWGLLGI